MAGYTRRAAMPKAQDGARRRWWARALRWVRDFRWALVAGLAFLAVALGDIGFAKRSIALGETRSSLDILYLALQLFTVQAGAVKAPVEWELEIARFLAPAVGAYALVEAFALIFQEQLQLLQILFMADHVVVCGLGQKGFLLTKEFRGKGERVVVIEQDEDNDFVAQCRERGAIVLVGNAADHDVLRKSGAHRAAYLVSLCGDDGTNAEIALRARDLVRDRRGGVLTAIVHIVNPQLCYLLREREIANDKVDSFRLEFFNVFDRGAQALLYEHTFGSDAKARGDPPHLLVVGLGQVGSGLVAQAAKNWWARHKDTGERLRITMIDRDAENKRELLCLRHAQVEKVCDLTSLAMEIRSPQFEQGSFLFDREGRCNVTIVYICLGDDSLGLSAALALLQRVRVESVPIVVCMAHDAGLAALLRGADGRDGGFPNLYAFGLLDRTMKPTTLLRGTHETLARAMHDRYVHEQRAAGKTEETNRSMAPWEQLREDFKESNRLQADHIGRKLEAVGCDVMPLDDWDAALLFEFAEPEVELLAEMEHERWMEERQQEGWTNGQERDIEAQTSPYLVSWEHLSENVKDYDRAFVRSLPEFLAKVGLQICRVRKQNVAVDGDPR